MSEERNLQLRLVWLIVRVCTFIVAAIVSIPLLVIPGFAGRVAATGMRLKDDFEGLEREVAILKRRNANG